MKGCLLSNLQGRTFKSNEEYREYLRRQNRIWVVLMIVGALLSALAFGVEFLPQVKEYNVVIDDYILGVYAGAGSALFVVGLMKLLINRKLMKDEEKLTEKRREHGDERTREINQKAMQVAALIMIFAMYAISLIGGLFYPVLPKILFVLISVFLVAYVIVYRMLEKRM